MSERRPPIIAFDGNHRVGKGTQLSLTAARLHSVGYSPHILRCDGSRPGLGGDVSDPRSTWWQSFKDYARDHEDPYEAWREGARRLLGEAAERISLADPHKRPVFLYDRSYLSRAQMVIKEGSIPCQETMYGTLLNDEEAGALERILLTTRPDILLYLDVPAADLLERLTPDDPKYEFRRNNIMTSQDSFERAFAHLSATRHCVRIDGSLEPMEVQDLIECAIISANILDNPRRNDDRSV